MKIEKKKVMIISGFIILLIILLFVIILKIISNRGTISTGVEGTTLKTYKKADIDEIDIDEIIDENINKTITQEIITEDVDLEYTTIYRNNSDLAKGQIQVIQEGRDGKQTVINRKTYQNGELIKEEQTGNVITTASIDKIVEVGTGASTKLHKVKKGDKMYVTSYTLDLFQDKDKTSNKITTLSKDNEVKILEISDGWYKISYKSYTGWVDSNCLIYREIEVAQDTETGAKSKSQLLSTLSENMKLNKPSGLTLEQFKKVLSGDSNDKNKVFEKNAEYFYFIEKQYNINGVFVAAVGIHESAWGTSKISLDKKNLFGYGANDSNPYENAYSFKDYSEGIDLVARVFVKYYLNPAGTKIYDNEKATGRYYSGSTLADVNKKYATDKNWHNGVYKWMQYLYNKT